jgi:hypothetical protein
MPAGAAHLLQIVVLAPGPYALLGGCGPLRLQRGLAQEDPLELDHARVREEQRGVVGGHQRGAGQHRVSVGTEVLEELAADLGGRHGRVVADGRPFSGRPAKRAKAKNNRPTRAAEPPRAPYLTRRSAYAPGDEAVSARRSAASAVAGKAGLSRRRLRRSPPRRSRHPLRHRHPRGRAQP